MIKNERQYRITKAQIAKFKAGIDALTKSPPTGVLPALLKAQREGMESQLADLVAEARDYEVLQAGQHGRPLHLNSLDEIPATLIRARIAQGFTQKQLAEKLGLKEQQIQRYEATEYATASFSRVQQVIRALNLRIKKAAVFF